MIFNFFKDILNNKKLIFNLAVNDCKARYTSSKLGILWAFIQPLMTILIFWVVFQLGFKTNPIDGIPFVLWYIPAFLALTFYNEALSQGTNSLIEYSYLVKKVNFKVSIIPVIKIISAAFIHLGFIGFIFVVCLMYKENITWHSIQILYYFTCLILLLLGLSWLFAAMNVFSRDVMGIVNILLQVGFWSCPIIWTTQQIHPAILTILRLNPLFYICEGYRNCFIYHRWFWEDAGYSLYFWSITIAILVLGARAYSKLAPYFDDVL